MALPFTTNFSRSDMDGRRVECGSKNPSPDTHTPDNGSRLVSVWVVEKPLSILARHESDTVMAQVYPAHQCLGKLALIERPKIALYNTVIMYTQFVSFTLFVSR